MNRKTARQLLDENIVIDTHLDLTVDLAMKHRTGRTNVILEDYMESFKAGGVDVIVSAIFIEAEFLPELALKLALDQIACFYKELDNCNGAFVLATCTDDIYKAKAEGKLAIILALEGSEPINGHIEHLRIFYQLGVRVLGLCWSRSNWAGDGSRFFDFEYEGYGLTNAGRKMVEYAQELGMLVDITHTNEKTFWDVVNMSKKPLIATHSNTRAISNTPRNLSDEQIKAIGKLNGVIGVNGANLITNFKSMKNASMEILADHMVYEKQLLSSSENICIGLDQCDRIMSQVSSDLKDSSDDVIKDVIPSHAMLPEFVEILMKKGFSDDEIAALLGNNVMRVFKETIG